MNEFRLKTYPAGMLPKKKPIVLFLTFLLALNSLAQYNGSIPSEKPELIIGLIFDQMRPNQIFQYWDQYGDDGFKKLIENGTVMKQAGYKYYNTLDAPGYATIATGSEPRQHGVVSDEWFEILSNDVTNCSFDPKVGPVGGSFKEGLFSPENMLIPTLGDQMKLASYAHSKVFGISLDHNGAVFSAGHAANGAYWFDNATGTFMSSSYYMDSLPGWLNEFNAKQLPNIYLNRIWEKLLPADQYQQHFPDTLKLVSGFSSSRLPLDLNKISKRKKTRDYSVIRYTPFGNTLTLDLALNLIMEEKLGEDNHPDYLVVNLSSIGPVSQKFGQESVAFEDMMLRFDQDLAHFINAVEEQIGKRRVLFFMTAAHGVARDQEYLESLKISAGEFNKNQALSLLKSYLGVKYGNGDWVKGYYGNQIYLNRSLIEDSRLSLPNIRSQVASFMVQFTGVADAASMNDLSASSDSGGIMSQWIQNNFNPKHSGDVMIILRPGWKFEGEGRTATGYYYDRNVPLIWYGWNMGRKLIYRDVDITSIAPTLALFLGIPLPAASSGKPVLEILNH